MAAIWHWESERDICAEILVIWNFLVLHTVEEWEMKTDKDMGDGLLDLACHDKQ